MDHLLGIYLRKRILRIRRRIARSRSRSRTSVSVARSSSGVEFRPSASRPLLACSSKLALRRCSSVAAKSCQSISFCAQDNDYNYHWFKADISSKGGYLGETLKRKRGSVFIQKRKKGAVGRGYHLHTHSAQNLEPYSKVNISPSATCAALGSALYAIGGTDPDTSRLVRRVDFGLAESQWEWKIAGRTINRRDMPCVEALDGKLYVFGGLCKNKGPWGEVYDPRLNTWKALDPPPKAITDDDTPCTIPFVNSKKIMVAGDGQYLYDVKTGSWDHSPPVVSAEDFGPPVAVENTVYWLETREQIYAYDIDQGKIFSGTIQGMDDVGSCIFVLNKSRLLHLGGQIFCVVWCYIEDGFTFFHFTKIRVYKEANLQENFDGVLTAYFESCQCYRVHGVMFVRNAQLLSASVGALKD